MSNGVRVDPEAQRAATVRYEDVDEVIGIAAQTAHAQADELTVDELKKVAAELDIPPQHVERAIAALEARRREAAQARARRRRLLVRGGAVAGVVLALSGAGFFAAAASGQSALRGELAQVEQKRAQVRNVVDRQARVEARVRDNPGLDPSSRDAELAGAENRVAIERRRYDEVATRYNARAGDGFFAGLWARMAGLPQRVPLSNEVRQW